MEKLFHNYIPIIHTLTVEISICLLLMSTFTNSTLYFNSMLAARDSENVEEYSEAEISIKLSQTTIKTKTKLIKKCEHYHEH